MARVLAFDFGTKRVGVAVTDPLQIIANTLPTIATVEIFDFIKTYCSKENVEAFVVGYPVAHGHPVNDITRKIDVFATQLKKMFPEKSIHFIDETYTSKIASQTILMSGIGKKERKKKEHIDAISANLILQTYLEMREHRT